MKPITIPYPEFIKEHKNLVRILRKGSKKQQLIEANKQLRELLKIRV